MELINKWYRPFMVIATIISLFTIACVYNHVDKSRFELNNVRTQNFFLQDELRGLEVKVDSMTLELERLKETHPYQSKRWKNRKTGLCTQGNFFGFLLYTPVDTTVSSELVHVLNTYKGPTARVNSLRRHSNRSSEHFHGRAIDLAWDENVIAFLISEGGRQWLREHGITMYIEGVPGSKKVKKYVSNPEASEFVFFNPNATGDHIHLNI